MSSLPQESSPDPAQGGEDQPLLPGPPEQRLHPEPHRHHGLRVLPERGGHAPQQRVARLPTRDAYGLHGEAHLGPTQHIWQRQTAMRQATVETGRTFCPLQLNDTPHPSSPHSAAGVSQRDWCAFEKPGEPKKPQKVTGHCVTATEMYFCVAYFY